MTESFLTRFPKEDFGKLILRFLVGSMMLFHGMFKLIHGSEGIAAALQAKGLPSFISWGVPLGEVVAPILLLLGFATRGASLLIAFTMVMSVYLVLGTNAFALTTTGGPGGELNFFYFFSSLAIFFLGSGKISVYRGNNPFLK